MERLPRPRDVEYLRADLGLSVASEQSVQVEAASQLVFSISDLNGPIEVGTDTTYEVRVSNKGSRPATNVVVAAALPNEVKLVSGDYSVTKLTDKADGCMIDDPNDPILNAKFALTNDGAGNIDLTG